MGGDDQGMGLVHKEALQKAKVELAKLNVAIQEEGRNKVDTLIGEFSAGSEKARVEIQKMIEANPEAFKAGGVQDLFGSEVDRASDEKSKLSAKRRSTPRTKRSGPLSKRSLRPRLRKWLRLSNKPNPRKPSPSSMPL